MEYQTGVGVLTSTIKHSLDLSRQPGPIYQAAMRQLITLFSP